MSTRLMFRLAAAAFAMLAILVAALQAQHAKLPVAPPKGAVAQATRPTDTRLARCQRLGAEGAHDRDCLQA